MPTWDSLAASGGRGSRRTVTGLNAPGLLARTPGTSTWRTPASGITSSRAGGRVLACAPEGTQTGHTGPADPVGCPVNAVAPGFFSSEMTQAANQLRDLIVTAPEALRQQLAGLTRGQRVETAARFRPGDLASPAEGARAAMASVARRHQGDVLAQQGDEFRRDEDVAGGPPGAGLAGAAFESAVLVHRPSSVKSLPAAGLVSAKMSRPSLHRGRWQPSLASAMTSLGRIIA